MYINMYMFKLNYTRFLKIFGGYFTTCSKKISINNNNTLQKAVKYAVN